MKSAEPEDVTFRHRKQIKAQPMCYRPGFSQILLRQFELGRFLKAPISENAGF